LCGSFFDIFLRYILLCGGVSSCHVLFLSDPVEVSERFFLFIECFFAGFAFRVVFLFFFVPYVSCFWHWLSCFILSFFLVIFDSGVVDVEIFVLFHGFFSRAYHVHLVYCFVEDCVFFHFFKNSCFAVFSGCAVEFPPLLSMIFIASFAWLYFVPCIL